MCRATTDCPTGLSGLDGREIVVAPGETATVSGRPPRLDRSIIELLRGPEVARINFRCRSTTIDGAGYGIVACAIEAGHIHVEVGRPPTGDACYSALASTMDSGRELTPDTLYVADTLDLERLRKRALVVHEATHAIQDYRQRSMTHGEAEVGAYVAFVLYYLVCGIDWADRDVVDPPTTPSSLESIRLGDAAHAAALRIHRDPSRNEVTAAEYELIYNALKNHSVYDGVVAQTCRFDGFGTHVPDASRRST